MHQLLTLAASCLQDNNNKLLQKKNEKDLPLFNFYHRYSNLSEAFSKAKELYATLSDWYYDDELYNLIGFCRFVTPKLNEINGVRFWVEVVPNGKGSGYEVTNIVLHYGRTAPWSK